MVRRSASIFGSVHPCGDGNCRANEQRKEGRLKGRGISREHDARHGLLKADRFAEVPAHDASEIAAILHGNRQIEAKRVAKLLKIFGPCHFAEHLLNGVAGHDVRQQENHGEDQPQSGQGEQKAEPEVADHASRRGFLFARPAREVFVRSERDGSAFA